MQFILSPSTSHQRFWATGVLTMDDVSFETFRHINTV